MTPKSCAAVSGGAAGEAAGRVGSAAGGTSEDEDSDSRQEAISYQERRREAHTFAEQKRRDSIRRGYDMLQELVPACHATSSTASCSPLPSNSLTNSGGEEEAPAASPPSTASAAVKLSKACVLQKSIEYTEFLLQQRRRQQDELDSLRKELVALQILKANYERLVEAHRCRPGHANAQISDELKFHVFRRILDRLFVTFDASVLVENFAELSGSMIGWMEEHVTPHELHQICLSVLAEVDS